ncbi:MAG TPA: hypothetical protein VLV82_08445 [Candidatus Angelobacter sp.]|nr:hypothetical protein [Candidatus Angelobacter sp.]
MSHSKAWRVGGFIAALGASAGLIASATGATGAYFTDTHSGTFQATSGHLRLNVADPTSLALNFTDLIPGQDQTKTISYTTDSSSDVTEDVWVVFPTATPEQQLAYAEFTGGKGEFGYADGGLGRYGHFMVGANGSTVFQSTNLADEPITTTTPTTYIPGCPVNAYGQGGESQMATSPTDTSMGYCGVPKAILVASNLSTGATGHVDVTFGFTGKWLWQDQTAFWNSTHTALAPVQYQIVATQHGVRPDALNY